MEALRFEHQFGAYQVIVRREDLSYAWERFKGRIDRAIPSRKVMCHTKNDIADIHQVMCAALHCMSIITCCQRMMTVKRKCGMNDGLWYLKLANAI